MRVTPSRSHRGSGARRGRVLATVVASLSLAGAGLAAPAFASGATGHPTASCPNLTPAHLDGGGTVHGGAVNADLDGDGVDNVVTLGKHAGSPEGTYQLRATIGDPPRALSTLITSFGSTPELRLTDDADVDGDGDEEVLIVADGSATADLIQVWGLRDCRWTPLTGPRGDEGTSFLVGASVMHTEGVRCNYATDRNVMEIYRSFRVGDSNLHDLTVGTFTLADLRLTPLVPEVRFRVTDAELAQSYPASFDCERGVSRGFPFIGGPTDPFDDEPGTTSTTSAPTGPKAVKAKPRYTG